jgi:hypothetical protein
MLHLANGGLDDGWISVPQRDGTQAHAGLDELVPVYIAYMAPSPSDDERRTLLRILIVTLCIGMRASGEEGVSAAAEGLAALEAANNVFLQCFRLP